jgi:hypothetical protein
MTERQLITRIWDVWHQIEYTMPAGALTVAHINGRWQFGPIACGDEGCEIVLAAFTRADLDVQAYSEDNGASWLFTVKGEYDGTTR